jgi:hypothetical protein
MPQITDQQFRTYLAKSGLPTNYTQVGGGLINAGGTKFKITGQGFEGVDPTINKDLQDFVTNKRWLDGGIKLPERPELPGTSAGQKQPDLLTDLISQSRVAVDKDDVARQTKEQFDPAREALRGRFEQKIGEAREEAVQEETALTGRFGTKRRLSTSGQAFIKWNDQENKKAIAKLENDKESALANFDFEMANVVQSRIDKQIEQNRQQFKDMMDLIEFNDKRLEADDKIRFAERDGIIAEMLNTGEEDPVKIQTELIRLGYTDTRLEDVIDTTNLLKELDDKVGEDLKGTSVDMKTFLFMNPDLVDKRGTDEFKKAFNRFIVEQSALTRKPTTTGTGGAEKEEISSARTFLDSSRGTDGYVDPQVYVKLRTDWTEAIGDPGDFDDIFALMLSPQERLRLGVGKAEKGGSGIGGITFEDS